MFPEHYDDLAEHECTQKGWLDGVVVVLEGGRRYRVHFYDPTRLAQDLAEYAKAGKPWVQEPGLIVVADVNREMIVRAIEDAVLSGFFDHLSPIMTS